MCGVVGSRGVDNGAAERIGGNPNRMETTKTDPLLFDIEGYLNYQVEKKVLSSLVTKMKIAFFFQREKSF